MADSILPICIWPVLLCSQSSVFTCAVLYARLIYCDVTLRGVQLGTLTHRPSHRRHPHHTQSNPVNHNPSTLKRRVTTSLDASLDALQSAIREG